MQFTELYISVLPRRFSALQYTVIKTYTKTLQIVNICFYHKNNAVDSQKSTT